MAALLVTLGVMAVALGTALPVWHTAARREREAELIFRGEQYARAIMLFQRRNGNAIPPNLDVLVDGRFLRKRFKDPISGDDFQILGPTTPLPGVTDPLGQQGRQGGRGRQGGTGAGGQTPQQASLLQQRMQETAERMRRAVAGRLPAGAAEGGVLGVVSRSDAQSLRLYNGRDRYNEWLFLPTAMAQAPGAAPAQGDDAQPGGRGRGRGAAPPGGRGGRGGAGVDTGRGATSPFGRGAGVQPGGRGAPPGGRVGSAPPGRGRGN